MALNTSGPISLAGATAGQSIALELGASATGQIALNDANVRALAGVASGAIVMPTNFYGKSNEVTTFTLGALVSVGTAFNQGYCAAIATSSTTAIVFWNQAGGPKGSYSLYARYITISGNTVSLTGSIATLINNSYQNIRVVGATAIDTTYSLLSLGMGGLYLIKLTGTTPALSGAAVLGGGTNSTGRTQGILTSTTYLVGCTQEYGGTLKACVVTRSGDTITAGTLSTQATGLAQPGSALTTVAGSSTTGGVACFNRVYPVTVSGTTATLGSSYITVPGDSNNTSGLSISGTANRYLATGNTTAGDNVGAQIITQSGLSFTGGTVRNFSFVAGRVPASSFCKWFAGSSTVATVRGEYGNQFVINVSGTTISATKSNMISTNVSNDGTWDALSATKIITPTPSNNTDTGVGYI